MIVATLLVLLPLASSEIIANLFEWSHEDVAKECKRFLHIHKYDGVQVSPLNEHAILNGRPWWERYQPFSYRVDAAKHMNPSDLQVIYQRVHNLNTKWFPHGSRPNIYQEISGGPSEPIQPEEYTGIGRALDFRYAFELTKAFTGKNQLKLFSNFGDAWNLLPWKDSVVFIDNHDTQRNGVFGITSLSYKQDKLYKMANGFMLAWPHERAVVMSSYSFDNYDQGPPSYPVPINENLTCTGGWVCEHRWRQIYNMVSFAKVVKGKVVKNWWSNENSQIAFCRGNKGFVAFNADKIGLDNDIQTGLAKGIYCDVVSGKVKGNTCTGKVLAVREDGYARVSIAHDAKDGFIAIHVDSRIL